MRRLMLVLLLIAGAGLSIVTSASAQTRIPINTVLQNTNNTMAVIAFCNATSKPKDLEGWVGQGSASSLVASLSGSDRHAITVVVPPLWFFRIAVVLPPGGSCTATIWSVSGVTDSTLVGPVAINTQLKNPSPTKSIIVTAWCNATSSPKDLEGWVGQSSANNLIASLSGTNRQAITVVVPPLWFYKIAVILPSGGSCVAWSTS